VSFVGCAKDSVTDIQNAGTGTEIDLENSIQFNTGITTRGQLVMDDYLKADFAVYGYVYRSSWQAAVSMAKPNVFISNADDKNSFVAPQIVNYDAGTYTYSPIVQWTGYKYSFFAYYPAINSGTREVSIVPSGVGVEGTPYVTYRIDRQDPASTADLMTASVIDTDANSSKEVQFQFKHRLSAIDVAAVNYCEYDPNPNNNDSTDVLDVTIEVHQANFRMTNLLYDTYTVSLDETQPSTPSNRSTGTIANFELLTAADKDITIALNKDGDIQMRPITSSEKNTTMIVIPQSTPLHVEPEIIYYRRLPDANGKARYLDSADKIHEFDLNQEGGHIETPPAFTYNTAFDFDRGLLEVRRYFIQINFTSDAVSVNIVAADEWNEKPQVNHEFM
jgi:hypothetical protein